MDPDAALEDARRAARAVLDWRGDVETDTDAYRLAEAFTALDGWLRGGGFPPADWRKDHGPR